MKTTRGRASGGKYSLFIFSMLTLFAQMFAFKNVSVEIAVIGEETQEVSEAVADSQEETLWKKYLL